MGTRTSNLGRSSGPRHHAGVDADLQPGRRGGSSPADQGVTAKTIAVGLPYVNFQALKSLGVTINDGNFPDAYQSVISDINAKGGINGRKLVLSSVEMNPSVPADATSSCTQLTEDDHVFVSISPVFPACYQQTHDTSVIAGSLPEPLTGTCGAGLHAHPSRGELRSAPVRRLQEGRLLQGEEGGALLRRRLGRS